MRLYLTAETNIPDLMIDYIEVRLKDGSTTSLNWDESDISRSDTGFDARYKGVYFDEEYANGRINELEGCEITDVGLYTDTDKDISFSIKEMLFDDNDKELLISNPNYSTFEQYSPPRPARFIVDTYSKDESRFFGDDPNNPLNTRIKAANAMYGWLYEKGILEKESFEYKDYRTATHFAIDAEKLRPYRTEMENSGLPDAKLAAHHILDETYTPCLYSGAIQLTWPMSTYRNVDGSVGRSWECSLITSLNTRGIYEISDIREAQGTKAAISALFSKFIWEPTLSELSLNDSIKDAANRSRESSNSHVSSHLFQNERGEDS